MAPEITEDTPQITRQVQGVSFHFYAPYTEGHVCNGAEAAALNQTRCENIKNNVADMVATANKKAAEAAGVPDAPLDAATIAELQAEITKYDEEYEFGMKRLVGTRGDPVLSEAKDIAWALVSESLKKKGLKIKDVSTEQRNKLIEAALQKYPQIMDHAKQAVAARSAVADGLQLDV